MAMTKAELKEIVMEYCRSKGWEANERNGEDVLLCADPVFERTESKHRWWHSVFRVVNVGGTLIGFDAAEKTGDASLREIGWCFDWDSLCEVRAKEIVTTIYERVEG